MHHFYMKTSASVTTINPIFVVKGKGYKADQDYRTFSTLHSLFDSCKYR